MAPDKNNSQKTGPAETGAKNRNAKRKPVKATRRSATPAPRGKSKKGPALRAQADARLQATKRDVTDKLVKDLQQQQQQQQQQLHALQIRQNKLITQHEELRRTHDALEAAREQYKDLYDFSPIAHLTLDISGTIVEANLSATTLFGVSRQELIGQPLAPFVEPEYQAIFHQHCQDVVKTVTRQSREIRLRNKAGISWVHLESLAIHDKSGPATHWRTALLDISERKEAEQTKNRLIKDLNRSQEYFRALFNWTPSAVGISTVAEGRLCDVNEGFSRLTGYAREEVIGRTTLELGLWADPSQREIVLREIQEQGRVHNREGLLRTKSGEIRSLMVSVEPIQLGSTPCLIYLGHDITERKRTEEDLRLAKFMMDQAADAVYWIDPQARILDVNEAASLMLGYSKDELCAMTVHDLNPDFQANIWPGFWAETRKRTSMVIETSHRAKNGRLIPIEVAVNYLSYEGKEYHCAFVREITERKQAEGLLASEKKVLELIATGAAMPEVLDMLMRETEAQSTDGMLGSVLLADEKGQRLLHGTAPSLPTAYNAAVHGIVIGPSIGSCGTAAFERKPVFVTDIATDPRWVDFKDVAAAHGLGACHSTPILSSQGRLLGTVAMYYRRPHNPGAHDRQLIERATQLAGIAIEHRQAAEALRRSEAFITSVVENLPSMIFVKDAKDLTFISLNKAGEALLGHSQEDVIGRSDYDFFPKEEADFFTVIDRQVLKTGSLLDIPEEPIETKHQGRRLLHTKKIPMYDDKGTPQYLLGISEDITERKQGEAAQARLAAIVEDSDDAIFSHDLDGIVTSWNLGAQRLFGYTEQEAIGRPVSMLFLPDRKDEELSIMDQITRGEPVQHYETIRRRKDGSPIDISMTVSPLKDFEERLIGASKIARDITERKRAEEALKQSEERFGSFVRSTGDGIVMLDRLGLIIFWNPGAEKLFGYSQDEILGKPMTLLMPERFRERHERGIERASAAGHLTVAGSMFELVGLRKDGTEFPNELSLSSWSTWNGVCFTGIVRDITERKRAEVALQKSEERYRSIFENAVEGIFQTTLDGKYVIVNPTLARMYGYDSPDDMIAAIDNIADQLYVDPGRRDEFIRLMQSQKAVTGFEALVYRKDGSFIWISENVRELRDPSGALVGYEGTVEQITQRKLAEQRVRDTLDQVRMLTGRITTVQEEERTRIARELHDELGVGLTCLKIDLSRLPTIMGKGTGGGTRKKVGDKIQSMTEQVDTTIASLQRLVTELRPALLDDLGLVAAIEWQCQDFQTRTGIPCTCVTSADDIAMEPARATALFRICQEALTNTARHAQATAVTVLLESWNNSLRLVVADNGIGIPNTKVSNHQSLGLIGMRERVALFDGEIMVQGHPEKGTTVTACLPVGRRQPES